MTKQDMKHLSNLYAYLYNKSCRLDLEYYQIKENAEFRSLGEIDYYQLIIKQTEIRMFNETAQTLKNFIEPILNEYRKR